jgi:hypothetical protein
VAKSMVIVAIVSWTMTLSGCVTGSDKAVATRKIIERSPNIEQTPEWVKGPNKFAAAEDKVGFKGYLTMDADSHGDACTHAAGIDAKGKIASMISSSVLEESGISGDDKNIVLNRLTAVLSKQKLVHVEVADDYWQVVEIDDGEKATRKMECWAQVLISKKVLDTLLDRSLASIKEDGKLSGFQAQIQDGFKKLEADGKG